MNRREASKTETRRLILKAARKRFAAKGMEACTIRDIAKAAGVSPASVIVHFKTKTALLEEALRRDIVKGLSALLTSLPQEANLRERLMHLATGFLRLYDTDRDLYRGLIRSTVFEPTAETPAMTAQSEQYLHSLAQMLEAEKARGVIRPEVDSAIAAGGLFSLYLGALVTLFRMPGMSVEAVAALLAAMTEQYLHGITRRAR